jgi:hypothetical protein
MTPPDATTAPARTARATRTGPHRRAPSRPPRRVSGPARGARAAVPVPAGAGAATAAPPLTLRLARAGARIGDARLLDRLVRGRGWIALVAIGLLGIVFMQVSMLRLNAGISRAITTAETLEQQNSTLRADISKLDAGDRIADTAAAQGMVRPPAGDVNYLDARKADGAAAAKAIRTPNPVKVEASPATEAAQQQAAVAPAAATAQPQAAPAQAATQTTATQQPAVAQQTVQPQAAAQPQQQAAAPPQETAAPQQQAAAPPQQTAAPPAAQTTTTAPTTTAGATTAQGAQ